MNKWEQFEKLAQELHVPFPKTFITLEVFDKEGRLIHKHKQRGHSWTRNAYNILFCQLDAKNPSDNTFAAGKLSLKDTGGNIRYSTTKPINYYYNYSLDTTGTYGYLAAAGLATYGILVGSGTNAESFENYVLQTLIANGSAGGQLAYSASELHSISYAGTTLKDTLIRYFNNNSGGSVSVNEVALVAYIDIANMAYRILVSRDKLDSTVTVPDTGQLKVTYEISLVYPS